MVRVAAGFPTGAVLLLPSPWGKVVKASDVLRLPVKPLWDLVGAESQSDFARKLGVQQTSVARWLKNGGIPLERCDGFAVENGYHPMSLWGEEWYEAELGWLQRVELRRLRRNERNAGYRANRRRRDRDANVPGRPPD